MGLPETNTIDLLQNPNPDRNQVRAQGKRQLIVIAPEVVDECDPDAARIIESFDSFAPIGPWILTADELPSPGALAMELAVNGERVQHGDTGDMVFGVAQLIGYVSRFMTLLPGDLIFTGTPAGVGLGRTPPGYLSAGDRLVASIAGLGTQVHAAVGG